MVTTWFNEVANLKLHKYSVKKRIHKWPCRLQKEKKVDKEQVPCTVAISTYSREFGYSLSRTGQVNRVYLNAYNLFTRIKQF